MVPGLSGLTEDKGKAHCSQSSGTWQWHTVGFVGRATGLAPSHKIEPAIAGFTDKQEKHET
jgi:hypothetical protein